MQEQPNEFKTSLASAPCGDPLCCCYGFFCQPCAACYWRKAFLEKIGNGVQDYVCCQGYIPKCCCCDFPNMGKGSLLCLCCEGCCCDVLSLSITRIYVMDMKRLHPDPGDYQIIQFSNCMQMVACICHVLAYVDGNFRELAMIVDLIADIVERCVSGCMSAQLHLEYMDDAVSSSTVICCSYIKAISTFYSFLLHLMDFFFFTTNSDVRVIFIFLTKPPG